MDLDKSLLLSEERLGPGEQGGCRKRAEALRGNPKHIMATAMITGVAMEKEKQLGFG